MPNPYLILAVVVFWIVSVAAAGWKGAEYQKGLDATEKLEAVEQAVADANTLAAKDKALAVAQAQKDVAAKTATAIIRSQANAAISAKPQPLACDWDQPSFGVLVAAVNTANGDPAGIPGLSDAVSKANRSGEQQGGRGARLGR